MLSRFKRFLPTLAVVGAIMFMITILMSASYEQAFLTDTSQTRPVVEATLGKLQAQHPISIDAPTFRRAVEQLTRDRYVANVWLFAPDGRKIYSSCPFGASAATAEEYASIDIRGVLDSLPAGALSQEQRTMLLAASFVRAEWSHNDIYRHLVYPIRNANGATVALIGISYEIFADTPRFSLLEIAVGLLLRLGGLLLYWLSLPLWVLLDARERGGRAWAWATFVFIGNLVALITYILARAPRPETISSH